MEAFGAYGFSRTTMEDISRASGVARTALYRTFRSKEDIFRALAETVHAQALDLAVAELAGEAPFAQRLENALVARDLHLLQVGHSGPHADEIAGLYLSLSSDLADQSNEAFAHAMTRATRAAIKADSFQLKASFRSPTDFVHLLRLSLEGVKKEVKSATAFEKLARQLIRAIVE